MNKYESAYEFIELCVRPWEHKSQELDRPVMNTQKQDNMDILKELVEKEKPKKLDMMRYKKYDGYNIGICKCGAIIDTSLNDDKINYCYKCGSRIDWGEEE